jgi:hypothetical protein
MTLGRAMRSDLVVSGVAASAWLGLTLLESAGALDTRLEGDGRRHGMTH